MRLLIVIFTLLLSGCMSAPTKQQTDSANYGPVPNNHETTIKNSLQYILKDPSSAVVQRITKPRKEWFLNPENLNTKFDYAWLSCALINAKNSFGGFTGAKQYVFFIKNNKVIYYQADQLNSGRIVKCA